MPTPVRVTLDYELKSGTYVVEDSVGAADSYLWGQGRLLRTVAHVQSLAPPHARPPIAGTLE